MYFIFWLEIFQQRTNVCEDIPVVLTNTMTRHQTYWAKHCCAYLVSEKLIYLDEDAFGPPSFQKYLRVWTLKICTVFGLLGARGSRVG